MYALVVAVVLTVLLAGILVTSRRDDQATITVEGDDLVVRPIGLMAVWATRREVRIPWSRVASIEAADRADCPTGFRAPGTYLPKFLQAGSFLRDGGRSIWMVGRAQRLVLVRTTDGDPTAVVIQVADPDATAAALRDQRTGA